MTEAQRKAFIKEIAPLAQYAYATLGKVKPSVCIGMACVESGYGGSKLMYNHHAVLGQKVGSGRTATKYWPKTFFVAKTKEEYTVGKHTVIKDAFRSYDNMQQCILNYYELLNTSLYKRVLASSDYKTQMKQIKECGYMTSSTEVNSVLYAIGHYNLTQYDSDFIAVEPEIPVIAKPVLKYGSKGEAVKAWQTFLNQNGYDCGAIDGVFGKRTKQAVIAYQKDHPECGEPDGIIGPKTWASLK